MLMVCLLCIGIASEAQMPTDNSYLKRNYENSKTAKKRALKKAQRQQRKAAKKTAKSANKTADYNKASQSSQNAATAQSNAVRSNNNAAVKMGNAAAVKKNMAGISVDDVTPRWDNAQEPYYMEGALVKEGKKVVFEKEINAKGNEEMTMKGVMSVIGEVIAHTEDTEISKIDSYSNDYVKATLCEPIYFKQKKWVTDSTLIRYSLEAKYDNGKLNVKAIDINYSYESGPTIVFDYPAEEWITDEYALSKDKSKLTKNAGKFRVKTIDYFIDLFAKIEDIISAANNK